MALATVEQVVYRGFITQYHLRLDNGDPLIAFHQHRDAHGGTTVEQGSRVEARWDEGCNHLVTDDAA
jgi:hypothetical protein